jgi:hypothetical protein
MVKCEKAPDARPNQVEQVVALCTDIEKTEYDDSALYAPFYLLKPQQFQFNVISSTPVVPSPLLARSKFARMCNALMLPLLLQNCKREITHLS